MIKDWKQRFLGRFCERRPGAIGWRWRKEDDVPLPGEIIQFLENELEIERHNTIVEMSKETRKKRPKWNRT